MSQIDMQKVKQFAMKTGVKIENDCLHWDGPREAPQNGLTIPISDLGRTSEGMMYRVSIRPNIKNTLL